MLGKECTTSPKGTVKCVINAVLSYFKVRDGISFCPNLAIFCVEWTVLI